MSMSTLVLNIKSDTALAQVLCYIVIKISFETDFCCWYDTSWTRSIHCKSCTLHTGHWQNIYCNMRSTNCWRDAFLNLHKLQIISSQDKKKLDNTSESAQLIYSLCLHLTSNWQDMTWCRTNWCVPFTLWKTLRRELRKFGAQWSFLALHKNPGCKHFLCSCNGGEEQKMCKMLPCF